MPSEKKSVRLSLELSADTNQRLETLANKMNGNKSDVLRRAIAIYEVMVKAKENGQKFGIASQDQTLVTEIVGI